MICTIKLTNEAGTLEDLDEIRDEIENFLDANFENVEIVQKDDEIEIRWNSDDKN